MDGFKAFIGTAGGENCVPSIFLYALARDWRSIASSGREKRPISGQKDMQAIRERFIHDIRHRYRREGEELQQFLSAQVPDTGDLTPAVAALFEHQVQTGVLWDELREVERFQLLAHSDPPRAFFFTLNPRRADRHRGGGRSDPPPGWPEVNDRCFLCGDNIVWQQRFCQFPFRIHLPSGEFDAWVNPFPLGKYHLTIAADCHRPQTWMSGTRDETVDSLMGRISDLVMLASRLPQFLVFENGCGAGASIPEHHHYQALHRWKGLAYYPIETAAWRQTTADNQEPPFLLRDYPVSAIFCHGVTSDVIAQGRACVERWLAGMSDWGHLTTNLIASRDNPEKDEVNLFIVPRNRGTNGSTGAIAQVASLEVAGEVVGDDPTVRARIQNGMVNYQTIWETVAECQDDSTRQVLERPWMDE